MTGGEWIDVPVSVADHWVTAADRQRDTMTGGSVEKSVGPEPQPDRLAQSSAAEHTT